MIFGKKYFGLLNCRVKDHRGKSSFGNFDSGKKVSGFQTIGKNTIRDKIYSGILIREKYW